jgi:hypothetical protein
VSVIRKPEPHVLAASASPSAFPPSSGGAPQRALLMSLLEVAFGSAEPVRVLVEEALAAAAKQEVPPGGPELVTFVRAHLLAPLSEQIGPRLTMALVDDLVAAVERPSFRPTRASSFPPPSTSRPVLRHGFVPSSAHVRSAKPGVLLVDGDRVGRTTLARALLRADWEVTVIDAVSDLAAALSSGDSIDVALVDMAHPLAEAVIESLARSHSSVAVVARSPDPAHTRAMLARYGIASYDVRAREGLPDELALAVRRIPRG